MKLGLANLETFARSDRLARHENENTHTDLLCSGWLSIRVGCWGVFSTFLALLAGRLGLVRCW